jgi:hypothetical protein
MTPEQARQLLNALAQKWRRTIYAGHALHAIGLSLLITVGFNTILHASWSSSVLIAVFIFVAGFLSLSFLSGKKTIDAALIARHLDRTVPELEESSALLLKAETELTVLARLQLFRLLQALDEQRARLSLPRRPLRSSWSFLGVSAALALLIALVASLLFSKEEHFAANGVALQTNPEKNNNAETLPLKIVAVRIQISPPEYTDKPTREQDKFELRVEEGAQIIWQLSVNQRLAHGLLILSERDTLRLQSTAALTCTAQARIAESGFYYFILTDMGGGDLRSDYHKLEVIKDEPPSITITSPQPSTEILPEQAAVVSLQALAEDDYALTDAKILATLARGSGESVKFREDTLTFNSVQKASPQQWNLRESLDLKKLGMAPGDELYFFVEARDNRQPENNRSRSEIFFINLKNTARVEVAVSTGLAVNPLPEYFRSQRQIIIDTEKLINEKNQISATDFKNRSNNIGIDQQALRLRYGEFLGEESNSGINRNAEYSGEGEEHEEHEQPSRPRSEKDHATIMSVVEQFMHDHDAEENAAKLARSVQDLLRQALAEMWDAELHLRTHRPESALPYEYRALKLLKEVQQHSRVYVQRVGFEPTPIKVDEKRLSGDLAKIFHRRAQKDFPERPTLPNMRLALPLLRKLESASANDIKILERAGQDLARAVLEQPGRHLRALHDLRMLITNINEKKDFCRDCVATVERAFWNILPAEKPAPTRLRTSDFGLSRLYFQKMSATR